MAENIDARHAVDVWVRLLRDERLHRVFVQGRHAEHAAELGLTSDDVTILDAFRARPGTRWNIDNIRFRATAQVMTRLEIWIPMTMFVLTGHNDQWMRDLVFEYLTFHQWDDFGPNALTECERFGAFVRERVMLRRRFDPRLEPVLAFELAVVELLKRTRGVAQWPTPPAAGTIGDDALRSLRPRPGPCVALLTAPYDLSGWLTRVGPNSPEPSEQTTHFLVSVTTLTKPHRVQRVGDGARVVYEHCDGDRTVAEIARSLEAELDEDALVGVVRRWLEAGVLVA